MEGEDPEVCTLKKGQDWAPGEKIRDILGIGVRWDHSQHSPKSYIFHSNLYELRAVLNNWEDTICSHSSTFIGTGNINILRKISQRGRTFLFAQQKTYFRSEVCLTIVQPRVLKKFKLSKKRMRWLVVFWKTTDFIE